MLLAVAVSEIRRPRNRNLVAILVVATLLLLVQGQAWWIFTKLETASHVQQLFQLITADGARLANLYLALAVTAFTVLYFAASRRRRAATDSRPPVAVATGQTPYVLAGA